MSDPQDFPSVLGRFGALASTVAGLSDASCRLASGAVARHLAVRTLRVYATEPPQCQSETGLIVRPVGSDASTTRPRDGPPADLENRRGPRRRQSRPWRRSTSRGPPSRRPAGSSGSPRSPTSPARPRRPASTARSSPPAPSTSTAGRSSTPISPRVNLRLERRPPRGRPPSRRMKVRHDALREIDLGLLRMQRARRRPARLSASIVRALRSVSSR